MKFRMKYFNLVLFLALFVGAPDINQVAHSESSEEIRNKIRKNVESVAEAMANGRSRMTARYAVMEGNFQTGTWAWSSNSNGQTAQRNAKRDCEKHGVGCDRLFSICIHNDTPYTVNVYLFQPWESNHDDNSSLWNWTYSPGNKSNLAVSGNRIYLSKRFFLKVVASGSDNPRWGPKSIDDFVTNLNNYKDGQNLLIRLTYSGR